MALQNVLEQAFFCFLSQASKCLFEKLFPPLSPVFTFGAFEWFSDWVYKSETSLCTAGAAVHRLK